MGAFMLRDSVLRGPDTLRGDVIVPTEPGVLIEFTEKQWFDFTEQQRLEFTEKQWLDFVDT